MAGESVASFYRMQARLPSLMRSLVTSASACPLAANSSSVPAEGLLQMRGSASCRQKPTVDPRDRTGQY